MSILLDENTRLLVQGITGREGRFHTVRMLEYGTNVVAGVRPGKGGTRVEGVPVFDTVREAVQQTSANTSILFVPPRATLEAIFESLDAGIGTIVAIAEGVPVKDMMIVHHYTKDKPGVHIIGPNSFGAISPGKSKVGFMAHEIYSPGPVGLMSRSGTNSYEAALAMTKLGIGQSTCIGVGGDMIPGSSFSDLLPLFEADLDTKAVVLLGEIGGADEEIAAKYIKEYMRKPVVAYIAGQNAPEGKVMGHAGAIVGADGVGSAKSKIESLTAAGVHIADSSDHVAELLAKIL